VTPRGTAYGVRPNPSRRSLTCPTRWSADVQGRNLALFGMMGAGKSTVGAEVARRLGRRFADTDAEIERWSGRTIPELFAAHGEAGFRKLERQVVIELSRFHDLVLGLGGGTVLDDDNVADLLLTGVLVELRATPEVLLDRLRGTGAGRPLLAGDDLDSRVRDTFAQREQRYTAVADVQIDAGRDLETVVSAVVDWAREAGDVLTPSEHEQVMP
jgi:shikimate kinase